MGGGGSPPFNASLPSPPFCILQYASCCPIQSCLCSFDANLIIVEGGAVGMVGDWGICGL